MIVFLFYIVIFFTMLFVGGILADYVLPALIRISDRKKRKGIRQK